MRNDHASARPRLSKVVARASTNPINLGVGAAAATLALGLGSVPLAALGVLAYGALVAFDTFNPAFWKRVYAPAVARLPAPAAVHDPVTRAAVAQLHAARTEIERVLADTPADVRVQLAATLASVRELEAHASRLVTRAQDLARYLAAVNDDALRADVALLAQRARATHDASAREGYEGARAARHAELRTIDELRAAKDRIDANLSHLVATLAALPTKVVHMRTLDAQAQDLLSGDLNAELEAMGVELETSESVMKSIGEVMQ